MLWFNLLTMGHRVKKVYHTADVCDGYLNIIDWEITYITCIQWTLSKFGIEDPPFVKTVNHSGGSIIRYESPPVIIPL